MLFWFRLGWTAGLMVLKWFKVDGNWFVVYVDSRLRVLIMVMYGTGFLYYAVGMVFENGFKVDGNFVYAWSI